MYVFPVAVSKGKYVLLLTLLGLDANKMGKFVFPIQPSQ